VQLYRPEKQPKVSKPKLSLEINILEITLTF
jgi:hypothetical protein